MAPPRRRVLFIDSADPIEVEKALKIGFQGVTTNPSLAAKSLQQGSNKAFLDVYIDHMNNLANICRKYPLLDGSLPPLSVEVISLVPGVVMPEPKEMIEQAENLRRKILYGNLYIKIPVAYKDKDYLDVIKELARRGFQINATCAFSASQLMMVAQAGARVLSLFYNRLIDYYNALPNSQGNGQELALAELKKVREYLDNFPGLNSEIILGSIRKAADVTNGWAYGADIVTAGYKVVPGLMKHEATDVSVDGFDKDLKALMKF